MNGHETFDKAQKRQQRKHNAFPLQAKVKEWENACNRGKVSKKRKKSAPSVASFNFHDDDEEQLFEEDDCVNELPAAAFPHHKDLLFGAG